MATQKGITELADRIMAPHLALQDSHAQKIQRLKIRYTRLFYILSIAATIIYIALIAYRAIKQEPIDMLPVTIAPVWLILTTKARRSFLLAKQSISAT